VAGETSEGAAPWRRPRPSDSIAPRESSGGRYFATSTNSARRLLAQAISEWD